MRLARLSLENFRCYTAQISLTFDDLTAVVGRNDVGKSALMDALNIFFEETKLEKDDASVQGDVRAVRITCEFDELPPKLVIDVEYETSLRDEYLLNAAGNLEIRKTFDASGANPKAPVIEAKALHPTVDGAADVLNLKRSDLVARARELGIGLEGARGQANAPVRAAIWAHFPELALREVYVSLEKETGKQIWSALGPSLPTFALFKSDRASSDQDAEAQDPLKAAIREAIKTVEVQLLAIQTHVETEVRRIADATVEKIREMDPSVAETLHPIISTKKWDSLFQTSITSDLGIPLNKRGSGIRRLVLLNFFRANAEKTATARQSGSVIYAVEEPETSQHPRNQRMLMSALTDIASVPGRQVIITTHTPMLARVLPVTALRYVEHHQDGSRTIVSGGVDTNQLIAASLGVLPDHNVKLFVGVEGKHDITFLKGISKVLRVMGHDVPDLEAAEIAGELIFFPFGGNNLALWASRLSQLNRPEFHVCDRDDAPPAQPKYAQHIATVNARAGCRAVTTAKREMENYLHPDAVCEAYQTHGLNITLNGLFGDFDDVPIIVAQAVHHVSGNPWPAHDENLCGKKSSQAKVQLNNGAVSKMTAARLAQTDPQNEVLSWLTDIRDMMMVGI